MQAVQTLTREPGHNPAFYLPVRTELGKEHVTPLPPPQKTEVRRLGMQVCKLSRVGVLQEQAKRGPLQGNGGRLSPLFAVLSLLLNFCAAEMLASSML